jgi:hypothetical protein
LQDDVEALAVLALEHEPKIQPEVVLAFAPDYGVGAVRWLSRFLFSPPWKTPSERLRCPAWAGAGDARPGTRQRGSQFENGRDY